MDYTCKHRLLRDHGPLISSIVVYTRCINIVFYRRIPARDDWRRGAILTRWAPVNIFFDGTRSERSTHSSVSRRHAYRGPPPRIEKLGKATIENPMSLLQFFRVLFLFCLRKQSFSRKWTIFFLIVCNVSIKIRNGQSP